VQLPGRRSVADTSALEPALHDAACETMSFVVDESVLPAGWTVARVREMEPSAELLYPAEHCVVADQRPHEPDYEVLEPSVIISFAGLCLCLVPEGDDGALWWMGQMDPSDGSIACWSPYAEGDDLEHAIRSL
jgi:hypothetical protein